jgi:hypothetical protein
MSFAVLTIHVLVQVFVLLPHVINHSFAKVDICYVAEAILVQVCA